ncbi:energy coupling factor transporter S component ThiW [Bacillus sp. FJAT-49736]|uniref:energy coupling factor transporter S component ThiW n=1 Tax=Bacillus sp. FJAT-49736 TaxID=2833582 RepID=UPI001BC9F30F|nr:energy coupling factor transporter S component ThiW [Bacillus sp. FJAT-49736]MBS4172785.1 energy coupling factor transporter S component ThiW [Bacillus sp. FJAT-49736]
MSKVKKMTLTSVIIAITTLTSNMVYIPVEFARIFPIQHLANVLTAVLLGPIYSVAQAFIVSLIRNMAGTGSIFAFPGSIIGAFLSAVLFMKTKKLFWAFTGEVVGTGIIGAICCYPIATLLLGQKAAVFGFIPMFIISSCGGALIGLLVLKLLLKNQAMQAMISKNSIYKG